MIADTSTQDRAEAAGILALQAAHQGRTYGEHQRLDLAQLLSAKSIGDDSVGLARDRIEALVGVLATVTGVGGVKMDESVQ